MLKSKIPVTFPILKKFLVWSFLFLVVLAVETVIEIGAQTLSSRPERGTGGKGTQLVSEIDSINLQNGAVSLEIPLASLPPIAGGKLSYTLKAYYNSKLWNALRSEAYGTPQEPGCRPRYHTEDIAPEDGWKIGGGYYIYFRDAREDFNYLTPDSELCFGYDYYYMQGRFLKPILRMPDGSEHEMRIWGDYPTYDWRGEREHLRNYYRYMGNNTTPTFDVPTRLYTVDGTFITAIVNPPSYPVSSIIYLKDGTRVETTADGQRIIDTNGNSIHLGYNSAGDYKFARDEQTGREIKWSNSTYNGQTATKVEYQAVGGTWQTVWVVWGTTTVQGKLYSKRDWDVNHIDGICYRHVELQYSFDVIREIIMPATEQSTPPQKYTFAYNSDQTTQATTNDVRWACGQLPQSYTRTVSLGTGELSQITTPTGAQIKYTYSNDGKHNIGSLWESSVDEFIRNVITQKQVLHDGETDTWIYDIDTSVMASSGSVTNPDGSFYSEQFYPVNPLNPSLSDVNGLGGLTYRTNQSGKIITEKSWTLLGGSLLAFGSVDQKVSYNPVVTTEYTSLLDDQGNRVKMSAKKFQYDYNGELIQTIEYDWFDPATVTFVNNFPQGVPANAIVLRVVNNSYYNQAASATDLNSYQQRPLGANSTAILGALKETSIGDSIVAQSITRYSYDNQPYGTAPTKGNLTQISSWDDSNNQWINSNFLHDAYGNIISKIDPNGNVTQIFYEDATHAMPTKTVVDPNNGSGPQITTTTYDFYTGAVLTTTDINGNVSSIDYTNHMLGAVDPFGRPGTTYGPYVSIDGVIKRQTIKTYYEDSARRIRVETDLFNEGDALLKTRETRDQLGRVILTEKNENGSSDYKIFTQIVYKTGDRVVLTSNPHRSVASTTDGWTRTTTDVLGRTIEVATFSAAAQPPVTGTNQNWTGSVITVYTANTTTVTDQAGKVRRSIADALGRLVRVDEPNDSGQLEANGSPAQPTFYEYDSLGNLRKVIQGVQTREFFYDSLSRLKEAINPESGVVKYTYDANGNLKTKRDARGVKTIYDYDGLNRVIRRCYRRIGINAPLGQTTCFNNTETPEANSSDVSYVYEDTSVTNLKGVLTKVSNGFSTTEYTEFDQMGRVLAHRQVTDGQVYTTGYVYNLSGALVEERYPSGRVVRNVLDSSGYLAQVQSKKNQESGFFRYAQHFSYTASGAVSSMQFGNGLWESAQFNSRLQPTQIALGTVQNATDKLKLNYDYGTTQNNGNVLSQTITVPAVGMNQGFTAVQSYAYDSLNRLKSATEMISGNQTPLWRQVFVYDRYGNRRFDEAETTTLGDCPAVQCNPQIDQLTNRFATGQGYVYDELGSLIQDAAGRRYVYDGENKQTEVRDAANNVIGRYFYDGDGRRVKKIVPATGETTIFVYDASGRLVAEYSTIVADSADAKVAYLTNDHLGSPRINTDANGNVTARHDYHPFGEEIGTLAAVPGSPQPRTAALGYQSDSVRQKFTGYERDEETDLDFARARMYGHNHGRFTSPDPFGPWAMSQDERAAFYLVPQQWNRYAYVLNNPVRLTDPTGLEVYDSSVSEEQQAIIRRALQNIAKYGNKGQRAIANWILNNNILISLIDRSSTVDGTAGLQPGNGEALSQRLEKGYISKEEAASYLQIRLNEGIVGSSDFAQVVLEGVLNHEGRHAWVDALAIQSVSSDCGQRCYYSISNFTDELKAFQTEATYLLNRANAGNAAAREAGLGARGRFNLLSEENGRLRVNEGRIRQILSEIYGLDESRQGRTTIQSLEKSGVRIPTRARR